MTVIYTEKKVWKVGITGDLGALELAFYKDVEFVVITIICPKGNVVGKITLTEKQFKDFKLGLGDL